MQAPGTISAVESELSPPSRALHENELSSRVERNNPKRNRATKVVITGIYCTVINSGSLKKIEFKLHSRAILSYQFFEILRQGLFLSAAEVFINTSL